jgi:hypothetical protein
MLGGVDQPPGIKTFKAGAVISIIGFSDQIQKQRTTNRKG